MSTGEGTGEEGRARKRRGREEGREGCTSRVTSIRVHRFTISSFTAVSLV